MSVGEDSCELDFRSLKVLVGERGGYRLPRDAFVLTIFLRLTVLLEFDGLV